MRVGGKEERCRGEGKRSAGGEVKRRREEERRRIGERKTEG